jgi:hypothetical protein
VKLVYALFFTGLAFACAPPAEELDGADPEDRGSDQNDPKGTIHAGLPCDVQEVLAKNCQTCHGSATKSGASAPLVTFDDLHEDRDGKKVYELVRDRIHADSGRMPPAGRLAPSDLKVMDDWFAGGAAKSSASCKSDGPPPATRPFVCPAPGKVSVMKPTTPFTWTDDSKDDQYVCFGVDEVIAKKRHIVSLGPMIENLDIVHHVLLFQSDEAESAEPHPCAALSSVKWKMITGWAPGGGNFELPPEAGFPLETGQTHWVLQIHYNNTRHLKNQSDSSGYQICTTDQLRPNDAGVIAFGSKSFTIPPRTAKHTITCDYELGSAYAGVKMFGATPHMHTRGTSITTERIPGGTGTPELMFGQTPFNFENQSNFPLDDKPVEAGDVMRTTCTWKNPDDTTVKFGENTSDEMCFNFFTYYPAIPDKSIGPVPIQKWFTPTLQVPLVGAKCTEE